MLVGRDRKLVGIDDQVNETEMSGESCPGSDPYSQSSCHSNCEDYQCGGGPAVITGILVKV